MKCPHCGEEFAIGKIDKDFVDEVIRKINRPE